MEELLGLIRNLSVVEDYHLISCTVVHLNRLQHVISFVDNKSCFGEEEQTITIEISKKTERHFKECMAHLLHSVIIKDCTSLKQSLTLLNNVTQSVITRGEFSAFYQWLVYDLTAYLPWCHKFPFEPSRGRFTPKVHYKDVNSLFVAEKVANLINYCYNNDDYLELEPDLQTIGTPLNWIDKEWLTTFFTICEFCLIVVDSFSFNFKSTSWNKEIQQDSLTFHCEVHFNVHCYHDSGYQPQNTGLRPLLPKFSDLNGAVEFYKAKNYGLTKLEFVLPISFRATKETIAQRIKFWTDKQGINFFL
jgi:hypothetical protein